MSRSGYSYDYEHMELYRRTVENAMNGKRGQTFLRELLEALDALEDKKLIVGALKDDRGVCAIGAVGLRRGIDMSGMDPEDPDLIGSSFGIARAMAAEIEFENDEAYCGVETDEERFQRVRKWVVENLREYND